MSTTSLPYFICKQELKYVQVYQRLEGLTCDSRSAAVCFAIGRHNSFVPGEYSSVLELSFGMVFCFAYLPCLILFALARFWKPELVLVTAFLANLVPIVSSNHQVI